MTDYKKQAHQLAKNVVESFIKNNQTLTFAESMTGGLLASQITGIADASKVLSESFVVYSDLAKIKFLHCHPSTIETHGVYSAQVIEEMINGLSIESNADVLVAVSGIAGPKTYQGLKVGTVFIGIKKDQALKVYQEQFSGDRDHIRYQTAIFIFKKLMK